MRWRKSGVGPIGSKRSIVLTLAAASLVAASRPCVGDNPAPAAAAFRRLPLNAASTDSLRTTLEAGELAKTPSILLGGAFDSSLPDLVFYFGNSRNVRLVHRKATHRKLRSARHLWVQVYASGQALARVATSDSRVARPGKVTMKEPAPAGDGKPGPGIGDVTYDYVDKAERPTIRMEPLNYRRGIAESTVLKGLLGLFGAHEKVPSGEGAEAKDETQGIDLSTIGHTSSGDSLLLGYAKFSLRENTVNRFRVALGDSLRGYATIPNYANARTGLSVATVVRGPAKKRLQWRDTSVEPYLLFHLYLARPEVPSLEKVSRPFAAGPYAGASLTDGLTRMTVGLAVDHLRGGELGLVGGLVFDRVDPPGGRRTWLTGYCLGLSYSL